jgi:SAM-dependent methyltransferase
MAKEDEVSYLARLGESGRDHARNKPWSDALRGRYLQEVGGLLSLMPPPPARVLDLGAGSGWTSCLFAMAGYAVTATDIAPGMVDLQRLNATRYGVTLDATIVADFEGIDFTEEFDVVVFYDSLHHCDDEVAALRSAHRALKTGGLCITLEPGRGHHKTPASIDAMARMGTTERDMPPLLIRSSGKAAGFRHLAVYDRPTDPALITDATLPRVAGIVEFVKRFAVRATPLALTRGHYVVLTK